MASSTAGAHALHDAARRLRPLSDAGADLFLGAQCPGCRRPGWRLCAGCRSILCGATPAWVGIGDDWVLCAHAYAGEVLEMLVAHKDHGEHFLATPLGAVVASMVRALGTQNVVLVPVPSSAAAVRERGYDHAAMLAREAARGLRRHGVRARARPWLRRRSRVADQQDLGRRARASNQDHSMLWRGPREQRGQVVLVDDIVTTGATLREAVRAARAAGHLPLLCAVAATPRRNPDSMRGIR